MRRYHSPDGATAVTCFNVELQQFLAWFRVALVCQRQLGFFVNNCLKLYTVTTFAFAILSLLQTFTPDVELISFTTSTDLKPVLSYKWALAFLADRTYGRAYATVLRLSVVCRL